MSLILISSKIVVFSILSRCAPPRPQYSSSSSSFLRRSEEIPAVLEQRWGSGNQSFQGINRWSSPPRCSILGVKTRPLPFVCFYSIPVQLSSALFDTAFRMSESDKSKELQGILKSFYLRASEAEERLSKLEISVASKKESGDEELLKVMQLKLEDARAEQISERQLAAKEIQKLSVENAKLQYRITHLVRALKDADAKLDI